MTDTRWYLQRTYKVIGGPPTGIALVVEERAEPHRGYMVHVADRHVAREYLPILRGHIAEAIARQERPVRTFDATEMKDGGRWKSIFDLSGLANDGPG